MKKHPKILVSCGETSGDMHAGALVRELRRRMPEAEVVAFGGDQVAAAGAHLVDHIQDYAIMGFSGVLTNLPKFARLERRLKRILANGVDLFIPVDYPGLNLRLAAHAKKSGVPVLYYISPQVWAWGSGRVEKMARLIDFIAVILPFEERIYRERGIPVEFVGHPFVEDHELPPPRPQETRAGVGLLPGSRAQEVQRILPVLLDSAARIKQAKPDIHFAVGMSPAVPAAFYESMARRHGVQVAFESNALDVMATSRVLLVASGTATLQGALFETPLIIVYRTSMLNYLIARRVIKIPRIGLVNIVLDGTVCPEFIQDHAEPEGIATRALALLEDPAMRRAMLAQFGRLRSLLAGGGGCVRVAEIAEGLLGDA